MGVAESTNLWTVGIFEFPAMPWFPVDIFFFEDCPYRELLDSVICWNGTFPVSAAVSCCSFVLVIGSCCFDAIAEWVGSEFDRILWSKGSDCRSVAADLDEYFSPFR